LIGNSSMMSLFPARAAAVRQRVHRVHTTLDDELDF